MSSYIKLSGVPGESTPPGLSNAIAVDPLELDPNGITVTKRLDSTSLGLAQADVTATPYSSATLYFYDDLLTDTQPDASLVLHTALVSSITSTTLGSDPAERVAFNFASPTLSLFLEVSGLTGESSAPGHPGVIALDSAQLSGNGLTVRKTVDSTSTALSLAAVSASPFASVSLLVYENVLSETRPDLEIMYQHALVSSVTFVGAYSDFPKEDVSFAALGTTVTAPEPEHLAALALGLLALLRARRPSGLASRSRSGRSCSWSAR